MSALDATLPASRILAAAVVCAVTAQADAPQRVLPALLLGLGLATLGGLPLAGIARRLAAVNAFVALLWLVLPLGPGDPALAIGPLTLSRQGLALAGLVSLKANALALVFLGLVSALPFPALGRGLRCLGVPQGLVLILALTHRYLEVLAQEHQRMVQAATLRGHVRRFNLATYRTTANLLGMVLVRSLERAEAVHRAMLCRGFDGRFPALTPGRPGGADALLGLAATATAILALGGPVGP